MGHMMITSTIEPDSRWVSIDYIALQCSRMLAECSQWVYPLIANMPLQQPFPCVNFNISTTIKSMREHVHFVAYCLPIIPIVNQP